MHIDIPVELKNYIKDNVDLIDSGNFNKLYDEYKYKAISQINILTTMLYSCGIFPDKMNLIEIPQGYATNDCIIEILDCRNNPILMRVCGYSFVDNRNLKEVHLPDNCSTIGRNAFAGCENLSYIYLPKNLNFIGEFAFSGCLKLKEITFGGTILEWKSVIQNYCGNKIKSNAFYKIPCRKIKCIDGYTQLRT